MRFRAVVYHLFLFFNQEDDPYYLLERAMANAFAYVRAASPGDPVVLRLSVFLDPRVDIRRKFAMYFRYLYIEGYTKTRQLRSLSQAIVVAPNMIEWPEHGVFQTDEQASNVADALLAITVALQARFTHEENSIDLDVAIALCRSGLAICPDKSSMLYVQGLRHLGHLLCIAVSFSRSGTENPYRTLNYVLSISRLALRKAIVLFPSNLLWWRELPYLLYNLSHALHLRFSISQNVDDIKSAVKYSRLGLQWCLAAEMPREITAALATSLAACLSHLAGHRNTNDSIGLLKESVALSGDVLRGTHLSSNAYPGHSWSLAAMHLQLFYFNRDAANFEYGINLLHEIRDNPLTTGKKRRHIHLSLACGYLFHFVNFRSLESLNLSIAHAKEAISFGGDGNEVQTLAVALFYRYELQKDESDLAESYEHLFSLVSESSPLSKTVSIFTRYVCACLAARFCHRNGWYDKSIVGFQHALDILPSILFFGREYREENMREGGATDLGIDGAACCLAGGQTITAIEMLEQGRTIAWRRNMHMRMSYSDLEKHHPGYACRLSQIGRSLARIAFPQANPLQSAHMQNFAIERLDSSIGSANTKVLSLGLTERWDALVAEIRHLPGFEEFLRPTKFQQLQEAAKRGPVVIVNVSDYRSDAIAILCDGTECPTPITVPLGRNLYQEAKFWVVKLVDGTRDMATYYRYGGVKGGMSDDFFERTILNRIRNFLKKAIVWPILDVVTRYFPNLRRVWWCPTGPLTFLPLHMITHTSNNKPFVPSYTTNIEALWRAQASLNLPTNTPKMVAISCKDAPNQTSLAGVEQELDVLRTIVPEPSLVMITDQEAKVETVLSALKSSSWTHMACHGVQDSVRPYNSCFSLSDGNLLASRIVAQEFPFADFAFLSACHTATGATQLSDEAMHLAASFQFVGFRAVVATMWAVDDEIAPLLVEEFYSQLFRNVNAYGTLPDATHTAEALFNAKVELMGRGVPHRKLVPFIHIGV